ncbi:hypothetical protein OO013_13540 [Mangrovivirga sp. M17]|uniref:Uncharacterized protein n=1 Tax=Mangrovivirga halotolerans TaxID=2993936 RepID=A0ABT3RTE7_9BACT|nr:hypothetical protein [Mangrovivirga halotolerans]MCX2744900.1 hypothetical protein [Mangrovivirga halotolerans]
MKKEDKQLLLRKCSLIEYGLETKCRDESEKDNVKRIFSKLKELIEKEEITTSLGLEYTANFCFEKSREDESRIEEYAESVKGFFA